MTDRLHYKGFTSTPKYSAEDDMFYGTVDDVDAVVIYDSETAVGLKAAFMEAVDDYLDATDVAEIRFLVDQETLGWLERESARTGISLEKVASAMLRKACGETQALGAPDATVSAGRAETAEVRCDARRQSAMKDTCPYCEAGMIETDEAFSLDGPNGPITITGVHHNKCPECGEITFGPRHLTEMHEFKSSHRSMFP